LQNPYLPYPVRIDDIVVEAEDKSLKTFKFVFLNPEGDEEKYAYQAGQFGELSIPGKGEIPIGIASSPVEKGFVKFTVNRAGVVTSHLHNMKVGDVMGLRGPLGNWYPWDRLEGKNILIVGGGFAFTTLRSSIVYMLDPANRPKFGNIDVVYGARSPGMLLYKDELVEWEKRDDINMHITVDATDDPDWKYNVGFVPPITEQKAPQGGDDTYAIVCGPPIMIKFTQPVLEKLGYAHDHIIMSLENRMKCGFGMCGRCGIGGNWFAKTALYSLLIRSTGHRGSINPPQRKQSFQVVFRRRNFMISY
jgi:sulfhydrogenase subunit gamma (sulfur reductase)